tara:strand:- start:30164 stop:31243 length:1080 start_codon:yes stop_codon:yes gene_type:complete
MGLLEFANFTVPDVVKKSIPSFYSQNPLLDAMRKRNKVIRSGGTNVRVPRIKSGHSDISELNGTNLEIPLAKKETFDFIFGDWARFVKPIILPHIDRDRMQSNEDKKRWVQDTTMAVMQSFQNAVARQMYVGDVGALSGFGTLCGEQTSLSASGFESGALQFALPGAQSGTYMNLSRNEDTVDDENNWYNQYAEHSGFSNTFLTTCEQLKITADSYAEDNEGISIGLTSIANHVAIGDAVRIYGNNGNGIMYRPEDLEQGKAQKTIHVINGVQYYNSRFMTDARIQAIGGPQATDSKFVYLLNPNGIQYYVNANNDFRVTKFTDHTLHGNMDADVGYVFLESQLAVHQLLIQACTSDPA